MTWRDLDRRTGELVTHREIDRRLSDLNRLMSQAENAVDQARQIAREQVLKHDEEKNNLLSQINRERADFAQKKELDASLEKLSLELKAIIDRNQAEAKTDIQTVRAAQADQNTKIRAFENAGNVAEGKDRGNLALVISVAAILLSIAGNVGMRLIFG